MYKTLSLKTGKWGKRITSWFQVICLVMTDRRFSENISFGKYQPPIENNHKNMLFFILNQKILMVENHLRIIWTSLNSGLNTKNCTVT